ncbi:hypothetical protein MAMC_00313 [Methylacidimicrobium cyclopophantes]|uniref:Uncharacterized protein n=1 Tax=Methylacidimicrobium cyclopophantes TaxID=1041766 RepID=A0A5E6M982_9BACT|nr:hypothetical protein [Methylacidimicrobium cyclopophantes]VVM04933.1 hypothetical protein MAMC_00313 [Methylacidimicrobium cyclopophantes]
MTMAIVGGVSEDAQFVEQKLADGRSSWENSAVFGQSSVKEALYTVAEECRSPNWDGYGAVPVSEEAYRLAYRFLEALPLGYAMPTVGVEPDGQITFEWHRSARRTLSVSIDPEGRVHYSALLGARKEHGEEPFFRELPQRVGELIDSLGSP